MGLYIQKNLHRAYGCRVADSLDVLQETGTGLCIGLFTGCCSCGGTTCGAGELNGAYDGFLGGNHFEAGEVEFANLEGLAEAEVVDVDNQTFGYFGIYSLYLDLLHGEGELTTSLHTFGVTFELHGNGDDNGLGIVHFEEVNVEDVVLYGVELHFAENSHFLLAVQVKFDCEDVGGIYKLAHCLVGYGKVGGDDATSVFDFNDFFAGLECAGEGECERFAAVEHYRDLAFATKGLGSFLAEVGAGFGCELESFHTF